MSLLSVIVGTWIATIIIRLPAIPLPGLVIPNPAILILASGCVPAGIDTLNGLPTALSITISVPVIASIEEMFKEMFTALKDYENYSIKYDNIKNVFRFHIEFLQYVVQL